MRQLIESRHIRSIATLVAALPESYIAHHALMFDSRSPQEATFENPRAVVYGSDATFVIAFNGTPSQRGYAALDTMEFDRKAARFVFREIVFPEGTAEEPQFSEDNPASCLACHGSPPRPIWDAYPLWPGAYGERAAAGVSEIERRGLAEFAEAERSNPRYSPLRQRSPRAADLKAFAYEGAGRPVPNAELGNLLGQWNAQATVRDVMASPGIARYRYALLATLAGACGGVETIPRGLEASFERSYEEYSGSARRAYDRQRELKTFRALSRAEQVRSADPFALNRFRYVAELGLGLRMESLSLGFERQAFDPTPRFASLFVERATAQDPQLRRLFEAASSGDCRELQSRSLSALRTTARVPRESSGDGTTVSALGPWSSATSGDRPVADLLRTCVGCHEHGIGPAIRFDASAPLGAEGSEARYPHGTLIEEILFRLRPEAGARRMPLGTDFSTTEIASLEAYFQRMGTTRASGGTGAWADATQMAPGTERANTRQSVDERSTAGRLISPLKTCSSIRDRSSRDDVSSSDAKY